MSRFGMRHCPDGRRGKQVFEPLPSLEVMTMKLGLIACAAMALMGCAGQDESSECAVPALAVYDVQFEGAAQPGGEMTLANGVQRALDDKAEQSVDEDGCGVSAKATAAGWYGSYSIRFDQGWSRGAGVYVLDGQSYQVELVRK